MNIDRYHDAMERLPFDPALEARVLSGMSEARSAPRRRTAGSVRRRVLAVALAAALCLAVTAGATGHLAGLFAPLFGTDHPEIIDQSVQGVSASSTSAGYTLTAGALFGDQNSLYAAMTLTREDGGTMNADELYLHLDSVAFPGFNGGSYGARVDPGQGETDSVSLVAVVHSYAAIPQDKTVTLTFDRLARLGEDIDQDPPLATGDWSLSFPIRYGGLTRTIALDAPIPVGGSGLFLERLNLSPIALWVTGGGTPESDEALEEALPFLKEHGLVLTLKDGAAIDLYDQEGDFSSRGYSRNEDGSYSIDLSVTFPGLIPLEEMAGLSLAGVDLPLDFPAP